MKSIGIVICNYNKRDYVLGCIQSVIESKMQDFDIYVVDNASEDDSVEMIEKEYGDKVELIVNEENLGGSGGFNSGLRRALEKDYKYLMCIDNDVLLDEDAIGELYNFLETNDDVGMVGSKVYHMNNPDLVQQFGVNIDFKDYCVESKYLNYFEDGNMPEVVYSDSVAACSLMVKTSVVKEIGVMPEENFLYWDDTEWGYLCNLAGYKVASYGKSKVLHAMGAKKESQNTFPTYYAWRNWILFFIKYTSEEKLEEMARMFLKSIFNTVYEALYKGEKNRMRTIMHAYDDALHQVLGKASSDKIFKLDSSDEKLANLIQGKEKVYIKDDGYEGYGQALFEKMQNINQNLQRIVDYKEKFDIHFTICDYIFTLNDFSLKSIYVDSYNSILATQDDVLRIINYNYSKEAFVYAQQPLFLHMARKIRGSINENNSENMYML